MADRSRDPRTGRFLNPGGFTTPPPGALRQVSTPVSLSEHDVASAHARAEARAEERLAQAEGGGRPEGQTSLLPAPRADRHLEGDGHPQAQGDAEADRPTHPVPPAPAPTPTQPSAPLQPGDPVLPPPQVLGRGPEPDPIPSELDELTEAFKASHPAASRTDSPSRGIPTPAMDPGKQITGGWGPGPTGSGAEYFALSGEELRTIVIALAERLKMALDGDLRFGLSVVYPQVKISLHLTVDGRTPEGRELDLKDSAKVDLHWDRVLALDAEVEDSEETPAGKIRDDFQIRGPRKQIIRAGAARMLVDVPHDAP